MNNLTAQQRKMILICGAVVVASYLIHSAITFARQQEYKRQQFIRAQQQRAKAQAQAKAKAKEKAEKDAAARAAKAEAAKSAPAAKTGQAAPKPPAPSPYAVSGPGARRLTDAEPAPFASNSPTGWESSISSPDFRAWSATMPGRLWGGE